MASLVLSGDTSGSITVAAPAVAGSNTQTLVAATGTLAPLISGTSVSASGTSVDFTGIPSWAKRITVMFQGVSTNGTSAIMIRLGTSGGITGSGYAGACGNRAAETYFTVGFIFSTDVAAAGSQSGQMILSNISGNNWVETSIIAGISANAPQFGSGSIALSGTLTQVRITTVNGTDTFDAGTINILYE